MVSTRKAATAATPRPTPITSRKPRRLCAGNPTRIMISRRAFTIAATAATTTTAPPRRRGACLFVKPDIYLVADTMVPGNTSSHTYQARWHLTSTNTVFDRRHEHGCHDGRGHGQPRGRAVSRHGADRGRHERAGGDQRHDSLFPRFSAGISPTCPSLDPSRHDRSADVLRHGHEAVPHVFLPLKSGQTNPVVSVTQTGTTSAQITLTDGRKFNVYADPNPTHGLKVTEILAVARPTAKSAQAISRRSSRA